MNPISVSEEQLNQFAIAAQQSPPLGAERQIALRQLVNGILQSGKLCYPQRGQFAGRYADIYDEAVQDLLLYICRNIDKYDANRASVMAWANMLLDRRFFREAIPKVLGHASVQRLPLEQIDTIAAPDAEPALADILKAAIEEDPEQLFQSEYLEGCPPANFRAIVRRRLAGQSWEAIAAEFETKTGTISSFYSRCLKKFTPKLRRYCLE